jgi:serine/threonine protein kinase
MTPAVDTFLKTILRSGLLDGDQIKAAYKSVPREQRQDPEILAEQFVKAGKLSRFQAGKLLAGSAMGLVLGPYQVLAPIGRGGMGTVYLACDKRDSRLLALKVLPPKRARKEERLLARFRREMDLCLRVSSPYLARTFAVGVELGVYFIAMEFVPGKDMSRVVQEQGPLTVPRAARLFAEVASALAHAHEQGVVHRDLKPSNIRVTPNDHAKVLDLGLALIEGEDVGDREVVGGYGYVVGSMDFIAPEQTYDATDVDGRADLYALGCSLYFALTGRPPFPGGTSKEKILRQRTEDPAILTERNPEVPARFGELVHRLMAKKPEQRPQSAEAVRRELLAWVPAGEVRPLDQADDTNYRLAVASLQTAAVDGEVVPVPELAEVPGGFAPPALVWVAGGLVAAWLLLMVVVMVLMLFR